MNESHYDLHNGPHTPSQTATNDVLENAPNQQGQPQPVGQPSQPQQAGPNRSSKTNVPYDLTPGSDWWFMARRRFDLIGFALCLMLFIWIILQIVCATGLKLAFGQQALPDWAVLLASSGPLYAIAIPLSLLIFSRVPTLRTRRFNLGVGKFFIYLIMCIPIMYAGSILGNTLSALVSNGKAVNEVAELATNSNPLVTLVFFVILAPIFEEFVFRKQIIDKTRRYGEKPAIFLSALAFGLFHLNLFQFFYAFGLGLVLGYVYMRTSRLRYTILMHMIINLNGGFIAAWVAGQLDPKTIAALQSESASEISQALSQQGGTLLLVMVYGLVMLGLIIAGIVLLIQQRKQFVFFIAPEELPKGTRARTIYGNTGVIAFILMCLGLGIFQIIMSLS